MAQYSIYNDYWCTAGSLKKTCHPKFNFTEAISDSLTVFEEIFDMREPNESDKQDKRK